MLFLFDAISASVEYTHYKIFEVDIDVYFAHTRTKWKGGNPPTDFYIGFINKRWETDIQIPELVFTDLVAQLEAYLRNRLLDAKGSQKPGWLY